MEISLFCYNGGTHISTYYFNHLIKDKCFLIKMQIKRKHIAGYVMHAFCDFTFNENELHANALVANCYKQPHRSTLSLFPL